MRKTAISNTLLLRSAKDNGAYRCLYLLHTVSAAQHRPQAYLEPCKTSKIEHFTKTVTLIPFCSNILNAEVKQEVTRLSFLIKPYNESESSNVSVSVFCGMKTKIKKKNHSTCHVMVPYQPVTLGICLNTQKNRNRRKAARSMK